MASRGYFGIGVECAKVSANVGILMRSAQCFGAAFVFVIGARYRRLPTDTMCVERHVPLYEYESIQEMKARQPQQASLIGIEIVDGAETLTSFDHPQRAVYLLGAEDRGLSEAALAELDTVVSIPSGNLNVAVAGSIVMYDRLLRR